MEAVEGGARGKKGSGGGGWGLRGREVGLWEWKARVVRGVFESVLGGGVGGGDGWVETVWRVVVDVVVVGGVAVAGWVVGHGVGVVGEGDGVGCLRRWRWVR